MFTKLIIENFRSIKGKIEFPFFGRGLVLLNGEINGIEGVDSNGAGKSSIYRALIYALYDYSFNEPIANIINNDASECTVTVCWDQRGSRYMIKRYRGSYTRVEFLENGVPRGSDKNVRAVNNDIVNVLGITREAFMMTLMSDGETTFARMTDADQKKLLDALLDVNVGQHQKGVAEKLKNLNNEKYKFEVSREAQNATTSTTQEVYEAAVERNRKAVMELTSIRDTRALKPLQDSLDDLTVRISAINSARDRRTKEYYITLKTIEDSTAFLIQNHKDVTAEIEVYNSFIQKRVEAREALIANTSDITCRGCNRRFDEESKEFYFKTAHQGYDATMLQITQGESNSNKRLNTYLGELVNKQWISQDEWTTMDWSMTLTKYETNKTNTQHQIENIDLEFTPQRETLNTEMTKIRQEIADLGARETATKNEVTASSFEVDKLYKILHPENQLEVAECDLKIKELTREILIMEAVDKALHKNRLPAFILQQQLPALEGVANSYLTRLSPTALKVSLAIKGEGGRSGNLEVIATNEYGSSTYEGMSKGERERINIALTLALRQVVVENHFDPGVLFLDELIDGLDQSGIESLLALLQTLADNTQIVCISHNKYAKSLFPDVITIRRDAGNVTTIDTSQLVHFGVENVYAEV